MSNEKEMLPPPYNQDFTGVLFGLKNPAKVNHPQTAAFLRSGVALLERSLGPAGDATRPPQSFASQRYVVQWLRHNPPPFRRQGSVLDFRLNYWEPHADFVTDLFRFVLWGWHYPAPKAPEMAGVVKEILRGADPVKAIHELCYWDMTRHLATPMFRLSLIASAEVGTNPAIYAAVEAHNREDATRWCEFYTEFLRARALRLRPGMLIGDAVSLLSATADGLAMRALTESPPNGLGSPVLDHRNHRCLLATAALALIASCTEPDGDGGPSLPLDQMAGRLLGEGTCLSPA